MRTIKFRGLRVNRREWVYSTESFVQTDEGICMGLYNEEKDVIPDTVGQFTGLYDKNGKEIYEGDIILEKLKRSRKDGDLYEIIFEDCQWFGMNKNGGTSLSLLNDFHEIKVIGNIHDNPELLTNK